MKFLWLVLDLIANKYTVNSEFRDGSIFWKLKPSLIILRRQSGILEIKLRRLVSARNLLKSPPEADRRAGRAIQNEDFRSAAAPWKFERPRLPPIRVWQSENFRGVSFSSVGKSERCGDDENRNFEDTSRSKFDLWIPAGVYPVLDTGRE